MKSVDTDIVETYSLFMDSQPPSRPTRAPSADSARLARALGKREGFESLEQETFINLIRAYEALAEPFARLFKSHRISLPLYNILRILRGHQEVAERGLAIQKIGEQMLTREPDMTRLIDRLEKAGLAERCRCPEDRRVVRVGITDKGLDLLAHLDEPVRTTHCETMAHYSEPELTTLNTLLARARPEVSES